MRRIELRMVVGVVLAMGLGGCSKQPPKPAPTPSGEPAPAIYNVNPDMAGTITGTLKFTGRKPVMKMVDMSSDPACVEAHKGKAMDETMVVGGKGGLADGFVYIKSGLEGKIFAIPTVPVTIDQKGCWFHPRVLGIQVGQALEVVNSDPVTHNIHPMGVVNREWNHSQGPGDAPLSRRFLKPEVMIPVKCNIHGWMHAFLGVVDNPYYAVSKADGSFELSDVPAGTYTLGIWHEGLAPVEKTVTVTAHGSTVADVTLKGK